MMDKLEKIIQQELFDLESEAEVDIERMLEGVHTKIRKRSFYRRSIYSVPVILLLMMVVVAILPSKDEKISYPGRELFMASWEDSWTESQQLILEDSDEGSLYEESIDYLIDENYYSYDGEDDLLSDEELNTFIKYLEET